MHKPTPCPPFVDAEGNSNTAKHMSTIDDMVRGIENFVRQINEARGKRREKKATEVKGKLEIKNC